jgi:ABC-type dipeptide/oligopeptide/nickel transport system ATPase component
MVKILVRAIGIAISFLSGVYLIIVDEMTLGLLVFIAALILTLSFLKYGLKG